MNARIGRHALAMAVLAALVTGCGGVGDSSGPSTPQDGSGIVDTGPGSPLQVAAASCNAVSNPYNFNGTSIAKGDTIWFSSVLKMNANVTSAVTIYMLNSTIAFTVGGQAYSVSPPNVAVTIQPSGVSEPSLSLVAPSGATPMWDGIYPANTAGNDFLNGVGLALTATLPGGANPVTWTATFLSVPSGAQFNWQWGAAAYTQFNTNYALLGVKPLDDNHYTPTNSDHAGTPENYESYVTGGASGGGGSNYTGSYSGTVAVTACAGPPVETGTLPVH
jgi:hypothetical protein